jgi:hypothetical protein
MKSRHTPPSTLAAVGTVAVATVLNSLNTSMIAVALSELGRVFGVSASQIDLARLGSRPGFRGWPSPRRPPRGRSRPAAGTGRGSGHRRGQRTRGVLRRHVPGAGRAARSPGARHDGVRGVLFALLRAAPVARTRGSAQRHEDGPHDARPGGRGRARHAVRDLDSVAGGCSAGAGPGRRGGCLGAALVTTVGVQTWIVALLAAGLSLGVSNAFNNLGLQAELSQLVMREPLGTAAGLFQTARVIGAALAGGLVGVIFSTGPTTDGLYRLSVLEGVLSLALLAWAAERAVATRTVVVVAHRQGLQGR